MSDAGSHPRRWGRWSIAAGAIALVVGGLWIVGRQSSDNWVGDDGRGGGLVDGLPGRTWVAVDFGLSRLPVVRFDRGDSPSEVIWNGADTCNVSSGPITFDGVNVVAAEIGSTLVGCGGPQVTSVGVGTAFRLNGPELVVTNTAGSPVSTRYVALDALDLVDPDELTGTYYHGATVGHIGTDAIEVDDCRFAKSVIDDAMVVDFSDCVLPPRSGWRFNGIVRWDSILRTPDGDLILDRTSAGGDPDLIRFDLAGADTAHPPTLASFLGVVSGRSWVLDTPPDEYPSGLRPSIRFAHYTSADMTPSAHGFNGCELFRTPDTPTATGVWTPDQDGWRFDPPNGPQQNPPGCGDGLHVPLVGVTYRLDSTQRLELTTADGDTLEFRDAQSLPDHDASISPNDHLDGRWTLDANGPTVTFDRNAHEMRVGDCTATWTDEGHQALDFVTSTGCDTPTTESSRQLVALFDGESAINLGMSDDLDTLYLSVYIGNLVTLRLVREE